MNTDFLDKLEEPIKDEKGNFWGIRIYSLLITILFIILIVSK